MTFLNLFASENPDAPETEIRATDHRPEAIEEEYRNAAYEQFARGGILQDCVDVEVRRMGVTQEGMLVFMMQLRLVKWEEVSALRLLLGLPILQERIRRAIAGSWVGEISVFAGLWLHPSAQFERSEVMLQLRRMILHLEETRKRGPGMEESSVPSAWSVPLELTMSGK